MKKLLLAATVAGMSAACFGQGIIDFGNFNTPNGPLVETNVGGHTGLAAQGSFSVALYWASAGTVGMTTANSTLVTTETGPAVAVGLDGYFDGGNITVPQAGSDSGSVVGDFIVVGWLGNGSQASAAIFGISPEFANPVGAGGSDPIIPTMSDWSTPLILTGAPEPATLAVAGLGAASLLLFRRKK